MDSSDQYYIVIGGGIAGVSCAQTLNALSSNNSLKILLLSSSSFVKSVTNVSQLTRNITKFDVHEETLNDLAITLPGVQTKCCKVVKILPEKNIIITEGGNEIKYTRLCVCTGANPCLIDEFCPYVIGIRDTQTVKELKSKLSNSKKVVIVGNGGIAMELVYSLKNIEVIWVIRDSSIGKSYFDCGAAKFLLSKFLENDDTSSTAVVSKADPRRSKYTVFNLGNNSSSVAPVLGGSALGPDWQESAKFEGNGSSQNTIKYECKVEELFYGDTNIDSDANWPLHVKLSDGSIIGCDFLVSATGVKPNIDLFKNINCCKVTNVDGIEVDSNMRVIGLDNIYAAGDVCNCTWERSAHWQQMRLWTQARQMGIFAAQCMVSHDETKLDPSLDFCFEIFTHVTQFFGHKVVLLGKYNCQDMDPSKSQLILRITPEKEYVKVVLYEGRMIGAVLVGETDLEETFENLILNGMDLSPYGENLLHPNVDLDDYFD